MTTAADARLTAVIAGGDLGTLATLKRDGRPQLSVVTYHSDGQTIRASITDDRAKTKNLRRDPRASLQVMNSAGWGYAVAEGTAHLSEVATDPADATVEALVDLYREIKGEHPDWAEYRGAMVEQHRLVLTLEIARIYGAV